MRKKTDYEIRKLTDGDWFAVRSGTNMYLFRDGKMRNWHKATERYGLDYATKQTHFSSKSAASRALNKYLRGGKK